MKNGTNVPMGPLTLADFIGLVRHLVVIEYALRLVLTKLCSGHLLGNYESAL